MATNPQLKVNTLVWDWILKSPLLSHCAAVAFGSAGLLTHTRAVAVGVASGAALPGDARHTVGAGQDGPAQSGHQLWAEPGPDAGPVGEGVAALQARTRAPVAQKHRAGGASAPEASWHVAALVGARAGRLQTLVDVCEDQTRE